MELGRQVRRGEQGIKILVPFKRKAMIAEDGEEDDVIVKGFGLGMVFDGLSRDSGSQKLLLTEEVTPA